MVDYLRILEIDTTMNNRIETLYSAAVSLVKEDFIEIFLEDNATDDQKITYLNLILFNRNIVFEHLNFMTTSEFNIYSLNNDIYSMNINSQNFENNEANANSKLFVTISHGFANKATYYATRQNCIKLFQIFSDLILPAFKKIKGQK